MTRNDSEAASSTLYKHLLLSISQVASKPVCDMVYLCLCFGLFCYNIHTRWVKRESTIHHLNLAIYTIHGERKFVVWDFHWYQCFLSVLCTWCLLDIVGDSLKSTSYLIGLVNKMPSLVGHSCPVCRIWLGFPWIFGKFSIQCTE